MEAKDMTTEQSPLGHRPNIAEKKTPTRFPPDAFSVLPTPKDNGITKPPVRTEHDPTKEEVKSANAGEFAGSTRTVERVGRNRLLKAVLGGGAVVAGGAVAYEAVPAVHRAVDSAFLDHLRGKSLASASSEAAPKIDPKEVFDNKARSGEIKIIKRISEEEVRKLDAFAKIDDHNTVQVLYPIDVSTSDKPDAKIKYERGNSSNVYFQDGINREKEGYFSLFIFEKVPAGSTILAPVDGRLYVFREKDAVNDHPFSNAVIEFQPREGEIYVISIDGSSTKGGGMMNPPRQDVFRSLTNAPAYDGISDRSEVMEQAIPIKKGQPILQAAMEINVGFGVGFAWRANTDPSKLKKVGETIVNGQKSDVVQAPATHLKPFLSEDGRIVQPQRPNN